METYAAKLKDLETLLLNAGVGLKPAFSADMEASLSDIETLVKDLLDNTEQLQGRTTLYLHTD